MSAILFVVAVDPFLRALVHIIGPTNICRAYPDDIAIVLRRLWDHSPVVFELFSLLAVIANLKVKPVKCILIPLWSTSKFRLHDLLLKRAPGWGSFTISDFGKYLGFVLGPDRCRHSKSQAEDCRIPNIAHRRSP